MPRRRTRKRSKKKDGSSSNGGGGGGAGGEGADAKTSQASSSSGGGPSPSHSSQQETATKAPGQEPTSPTPGGGAATTAATAAAAAAAVETSPATAASPKTQEGQGQAQAQNSPQSPKKGKLKKKGKQTSPRRKEQGSPAASGTVAASSPVEVRIPVVSPQSAAQEDAAAAKAGQGQEEDDVAELQQDTVNAADRDERVPENAGAGAAEEEEAGKGGDVEEQADAQPSRTAVENSLEAGLRRRSTARELEDQGLIASAAATSTAAGAAALSRNLVPVANSLEKQINSTKIGSHLASRPDEADLINSGVMRRQSQDISASLQAPSQALERNLARHTVQNSLQQRSSLTELRARGIYHGTPLKSGRERVHRTLQSKRNKLEKEMARDQLGYLLRVRPYEEDLHVDRGDPALADSLRGKARQLTRALHRDSLKHHLDMRPDLQNIVERDWYRAHSPPPATRPTARSPTIATTSTSTSTSAPPATRRSPQQQQRQEQQQQQRQPRKSSPKSRGRQQKAASPPRSRSPPRPRAWEVSHLPSASQQRSADMAGRSSRPRTVAGMARRSMFTVALNALAFLYTEKRVDLSGRGALKELIFDEDARVLNAVRGFAETQDLQQFLTEMQQLAESATGGTAL